MLLLIWNDTAVFCFYKFCVPLGVIGFCAGSSSLTAWDRRLGFFYRPVLSRTVVPGTHSNQPYSKLGGISFFLISFINYSSQMGLSSDEIIQLYV